MITLKEILESVQACNEDNSALGCDENSIIVEFNKRGFVEGICCYKCDDRLSLVNSDSNDIIKEWNEGARDES